MKISQSVMRQSIMRLPFAFLLVSIVTACGGPRTLSDQYHTYSYVDFFRSSDGRDTFVIVRGSPFAVDQDTLNKMVTSNMQAMPRGPKTRFTTSVPNTADPDYNVVWLFNGPGSVQANELCHDPAAYQGNAGPTQTLHVLAAYCRYNRANTWVDGWLDGGPAGVPRDSFDRLIQQMTWDLFPTVNRQDPLRDDRDRGCSGPTC